MLISYKEFVSKAMPEEKCASAKQDLSYYVFKPISNLISIPLISLKVSATAVTKFSLVFPLLGLLFFIALPNSIGFWGGWISIFIWNILDGVDGNIARYTNTCSSQGGLWDATVGWIAMMVFFIGMGYTACYHPGSRIVIPQLSGQTYIALGYITAINVIFPRLVMHKKTVLSNEESVKAVKDRAHYSIPKLIVFNLNSINGVAAVLFAFAYCVDINGVCMVCYFLLNMIISVGSLYQLLKQ